jgi:hypothetical protein
MEDLAKSSIDNFASRSWRFNDHTEKAPFAMTNGLQFPLELAPAPSAGHILAEILPLADRTVDLKCAFASPVMGRRRDGHDSSMHRLVGAAQLYPGAAIDLEILPLRT